MEAYYNAIGRIMALSLTVMVVNLLLGLFCPRSDKGRFSPFVLAIIILIVTMLFEPL